MSTGGSASFSLGEDFSMPIDKGPSSDRSELRQITIDQQKQINITGNGATLDGRSLHRLFFVMHGGVLRLFGPLTITNGTGGDSAGSRSDRGGAVYMNDCPPGLLGMLEIHNVTFSRNLAAEPSCNTRGGYPDTCMCCTNYWVSFFCHFGSICSYRKLI
jgi:hypothetical protein